MGEISLYIIGSINSYNQSLNATVPANVGTTGCFRKKLKIVSLDYLYVHHTLELKKYNIILMKSYKK